MPFERLDIVSAQALHDEAKKLAEIFVTKDRLKTNQLRNVFSAIEKMRSLYKRKLRLKPEERSEIEERLNMELILLKPKLAYAAGRQRSVRYNFFPFIRDAVDAVVQSEDKDKAYSNFFALIEIVVSYHKYFESK